MVDGTVVYAHWDHDLQAEAIAAAKPPAQTCYDEGSSSDDGRNVRARLAKFAAPTTNIKLDM